VTKSVISQRVSGALVHGAAPQQLREFGLCRAIVIDGRFGRPGRIGKDGFDLAKASNSGVPSTTVRAP
jgi:hypothetical protein